VRITRNAVTRTCSICERTLLMGERATRFAPNGGNEYVDVCALCTETALEHGWVKEGTPTTPLVEPERRRRRFDWRTLLDTGRVAEEPVLREPILRRLSERELAVVGAADIFNASPHRRTVGGVAKSLGRPKASIVRLSGVSGDLVITVAWDISWYQYRVSPESAQPVRLAERGVEPSELEAAYTEWNVRVEEDGRLIPEVARV
jgi:hypothetical protein